ncbi:type II secretion system protein [Alloalcanivorax mobilis]|uniref:type II secretion system protein n=1 Tax=Alloalcanivorax mobilis TaxID=2019569 RepID=UPI000C784356|nr:type II secretion system protein [Alloalcanivorax mobilis]
MTFVRGEIGRLHAERGQRGFTLVEILVVVGLIAMLSLAVLVVPVWVDDSRQLDGEVAQLSDTLTMLSEESLFSGKLMALRIKDTGWTPLVYDVGARKFVPAQGNGLQARELPESLELSWQLDEPETDDEEDDVTLAQMAERLVNQNPFGDSERGMFDDAPKETPEQRRERESQEQENKILPQVFFFPSGETTGITFTVRSRNDVDLEARRQLTVLGRVRDPDHDEEQEKLTAQDRKKNRDDDDSLIDGDFLGGDE